MRRSKASSRSPKFGGGGESARFTFLEDQDPIVLAICLDRSKWASKHCLFRKREPTPSLPRSHGSLGEDTGQKSQQRQHIHKKWVPDKEIGKKMGEETDLNCQIKKQS